eukprot:GHVP01055970.1.p1 GENE.GHVP01055970.1~~GHVP01055970.1.p1  ORF type:complete len:139 (+),score=13.65 GHVP01055970.1:392-808(+)
MKVLIRIVHKTNRKIAQSDTSTPFYASFWHVTVFLDYLRIFMFIEGSANMGALQDSFVFTLILNLHKQLDGPPGSCVCAPREFSVRLLLKSFLFLKDIPIYSCLIYVVFCSATVEIDSRLLKHFYNPEALFEPKKVNL